MKPPKLEQQVGIGTYLTETDGIGGRIKMNPSDFVVEEVPLKTESGKGEYTHFMLEKNNWDTIRAIKEISKRVRVSQKRFGYAGTKDRRAITRQRVSAWNVPIEDLEMVNIKDITLSDFSSSPERINLGDLQGNRFSMIVRGIEYDGGEIKTQTSKIEKELGGQFPNFFGLQRFGIQRPITHEVGKFILKGDFEAAVMIYLAKTFDKESREATAARKSLDETQDFKQAIRDFPKYLGYENALLNHLVKHETDFIGALRKLPKKLRWMFVHAYQSYIFNKVLSKYVLSGDIPMQLPLVGYRSKLDEDSEVILDEEGVTKDEFKVQPMPELSSKGELRDCLAVFRGFKVSKPSSDEENMGMQRVTIEFDLDKGCYATTFVREFMKNEWW